MTDAGLRGTSAKWLKTGSGASTSWTTMLTASAGMPCPVRTRCTSGGSSVAVAAHAARYTPTAPTARMATDSAYECQPRPEPAAKNRCFAALEWRPTFLGTGHLKAGARTKEFPVSTFDQQLAKIKNDKGFIAALDQSGGSTPKALKLYGVEETAWKDEKGMYDVVHAMRTRIISSPAFSGKRLIGAILFENTMDRDIAGKPTPTYLWEVKGVVPFLKVDKGLAEEKDGVQLMKPIGNLDDLLKRAKAKNVFGTKMRSVIKQANAAGIEAIVKQQFEIGRRIIKAGLVPIIEPEVDIKTPNKDQAEDLLKAAILKELNALEPNELVMLKLTIPDKDDFYKDLIEHKNVLRVVALSGGYSRDEANKRLARQHGMTASFSRALAEGLTAQQSDKQFNDALDKSIESIYQASIT
jgi:fructose-bisphosphate aldolase class I